MNIKDIARIAGVSVSTVSKVMNQKDGSISRETRDRVLQIAKEYNYTPYASVIAPASKTFQIGVLLRSLDISQSILNGVLSEARAHGYSVSVAACAEDPNESLKAITAFCRNKVDAVLWEAASAENADCIRHLSDTGTPYVAFNAKLPGSCQIDYGTISARAVQTLINKGHTEIACILTDGRRAPGFFEGYRKCLFENQIAFREEFVFDKISTELFFMLTQRNISGIVCSHFSEALKLYSKCRELRYRIPEDFSILSLKDDARPKTDYPQISAYRIPNYQFGAHLCRSLIHSIEKSTEEIEPFSPVIGLDSSATIDFPPARRSKRITVVGSINVDHYLNVPQLPISGKSIRATGFSVFPGGKATNEAVAAAKLGQRVSLLGNVGSDTDANIIYDALHEQQIDTSALIRQTNLLTGRAYIFVDSQGESMVSILSGASEHLRPEDIRARAHVFKQSAYTLINTEISLDVVAEACRLTHEYGGKTILKPSSISTLPEEILHNIDILVPNESELNELTPGISGLPEKAAYFLNRGVEIVIVTLGARGCYLKTDSTGKFYPAMDFEAVDNTGAADAFIGALSAYMLYGYDLDRAIRIAGYAAGFSITRQGCAPAMVDKNTLETYIRRKETDLLG